MPNKKGSWGCRKPRLREYLSAIYNSVASAEIELSNLVLLPIRKAKTRKTEKKNANYFSTYSISVYFAVLGGYCVPRYMCGSHPVSDCIRSLTLAGKLAAPILEPPSRPARAHGTEKKNAGRQMRFVKNTAKTKTRFSRVPWS